MEELPPENTAPEEEVQAPCVGAGELIREARLKARVDAAKLCADLRISPTVLAAVEAGEYDKVPSGPYTRALIVSLCRYLHLDSQKVLEAYAEETGSRQASAPAVSPYRDESKTHAAAHKQIFILILAVLLLILLLILGKVNSSSHDEPQAPADTSLNAPPAPDTAADSGLVSDSLDLDSASVGDSTISDSALGVTPPAAVKAPLAAKAPVAKAETTAKTEKPAKPGKARPKQTHLIISPQSDSVWVRILPAGKRETSRYLRLGKPLEITSYGAVTVITRQEGALEISTPDTSFVPTGKRITVDRGEIRE